MTIIPVLPVCLLYQIGYTRAAHNKGISIKNEFKLLAVIIALMITWFIIGIFPLFIRVPLGFVACGIVLFYNKTDKEPSVLAYADETIEYQNPATGASTRILALYTTATVQIIDAVNNKLLIGMTLGHADENNEEFRQIKSDHFVQAAFPMKGGRRLITFYKTDPAITSAAVILNAEGEAFCSLTKPTETGLDMPEYTQDKKTSYKSIKAAPLTAQATLTQKE
ncbi:MAG: hypothetical protein K6F91_09125 [Ruminococcus sp.]|nr:hypothetical protein [Ruminococcus sp.]